MENDWMFPVGKCSCGGEVWKRFIQTGPTVEGKAAKAHGTEGTTTDECRTCGKTATA
jgi:hypothetical protein